MTVHATEQNQVLEFAACTSHLNSIKHWELWHNYKITTSNIAGKIIPMNVFPMSVQMCFTLDLGLYWWLSVATYTEPDVSEACNTLHW
jgi:hypothetical protein